MHLRAGWMGLAATLWVIACQTSSTDADPNGSNRGANSGEGEGSGGGSGTSGGGSSSGGSSSSGGGSSSGGTDAGVDATPPPPPVCPVGGPALGCGPTTCDQNAAYYSDLVCPGSSQQFDSSSDPNRCGGCNSVCAASDVCSQGACVPAASTKLATGFTNLDDIAVDASRVFVTDSGTVWQIDKATGATLALATGQTSLLRIAIDASHVYFTHAGGVSRVPIGGGPAQLIHASATAAKGIVLDGADVYWSAGTIFRGPKNPDGTPAVSISPQPSTSDELRVDGARVYGTDLGCRPVQPITSRYFGVDKTTGAVTSYLPCNSDQRTSNQGGYFYFGIGLDGSTLIALADKATSSTGNALMSWDTATAQGAARNISWSLLSHWPPEAFVVDTCGLYWGGTNVSRLLPADRVERRLFQRVQARRLAVDATHVFWTDGGGYVGRVPK